MKILNAEQLRELDQFTIKHEPVSSADLMERAARACVQRLLKLADVDTPILIVCGKGNNGGDGLAIARLLNDQGIPATALIIEYASTASEDNKQNERILKEKFPGKVSHIYSVDELNKHRFGAETLVVDALLGTGINKPVTGVLLEVIEYINTHFYKIISIDVPSGLFCDTSSYENKSRIRSNLTLTFQFPKLAFLLVENQDCVPEFEILNIGLHEAGVDEQKTNWHYTVKKEIALLLKPRSKFSHKGSYGHAFLVAGSKGKSGAAIISAKACLRSGAGLLTLHSTADTLNALLQHLPEAMGEADTCATHVSEIENLQNYTAIGIGPGIGAHDDTQRVLKKLLNYYSGKLVIDADGLNILAENKTWLNFLPAGCILTPHPKEFERLTEKHANDLERLQAARHFAMTYRCILILKGAHSAIAMPDGNIFFNSSGNSGLAKGGSGDALTGIILGLLSRGYNAPQSALIGTFIHGFAADICVKKQSKESLLISDVIAALSKAFKKLEGS